MKKLVIIMIVAVMLAAMLSFASAAYVSYSVTSTEKILTKYNSTNSDQTITYNTRPSTGQGGVHLGIYRLQYGIYVYESGKQFPYFQSVTAMTSDMPAQEYRYMFAYPLINGQLVEGNVTYSTSY